MKRMHVKLCTAIAATLIAATSFAADTDVTFDPKTCKVEYPPQSRTYGEEGTTTGLFLITANGTVAERKLEKSSGHWELDRAAMRGLSRCRFIPGSKNGEPTENWLRINYVFGLK